MRRPLAAILLCVGLALNLAALVLPFLQVSVGLGGEEDYSLLHTVRLLWNSGFPYLALLVAGFSVVFPFAKLAVLGGVWAGRLDPHWGSRVGAVGKWSMLDLFLVVLLLAVAYDRILVTATPEPGLLVFALAITCSMLAGELLHPPEDADVPPRRGIAMGVLLGCAFLGTFAALLLPLFSTDAWFLSDAAYSIAGLVPTLWKSGAAVPAIAVALFLIAMPLARLACLVLVRRRGGPWAGRAALLSRWSMLEPFALALAIFVIEGKDQVPTALAPGAVALIVAIVVSTTASWILARR